MNVDDLKDVMVHRLDRIEGKVDKINGSLGNAHTEIAVMKQRQDMCEKQHRKSSIRRWTVLGWCVAPIVASAVTLMAGRFLSGR